MENRGSHPNSQANIMKAHESGAADATKFGGERANVHSSAPGKNKPWCIRSSLQYLSHVGIEIPQGKNVFSMTIEELVALLLPGKFTLIQHGAAVRIARWAKGEGDEGYMTDQISGKLAQTNLNADFAAIKGMSYEQLLDVLNQPLPPGIEGTGQDGTEQPACGAPDDAGEAERP